MVSLVAIGKLYRELIKQNIDYFSQIGNHSYQNLVRMANSTNVSYPMEPR